MIAEDMVGNILVQGDYVVHPSGARGTVFHVGTDSATLSQRSVIVRIDEARLTAKAHTLTRIEAL